MELVRVTSKEYKQYFPNPYSLFNSVEFTELNKTKCIDIHYLIFKDSKARLGFIVGELEDCFKAPFSASYAGFSYNSNVSLQYYYDACALLKEYVYRIGKKLYITLEPPIYDKTNNAKTFKALVAAGAHITTIEYNHHFELKQFENYESLLDSKNRNKLRNALSSGLKFEILDSKKETDVARAYEVIRTNHIERGNPLRMSLQSVLDTIKIIPASFFVVSNEDGVDVAAAQIFHTNKKVCQIVYWGDDPIYSYLKSMNYLAYKVFEHYYRSGVDILDIGISTEDGEPNYGLCEFKENIGCVATTRFSICL